MLGVEFIESVDESGIVEGNIRRLVAMQVMDAKRMEKIFSEAMRSLADDITRVVNTDTFTEARSKVILDKLQWAMEDLEKKELLRFTRSARDMGNQAAQDTSIEIEALERRFNGVDIRIPWDAIAMSFDREKWLMNRYRTTMETYRESIRAEIQRVASEGILKRDNGQKVTRKVATHLRHLQFWKVARIVRTELHHIYNASKYYAMKRTKDSYIPGLKKGLMHPMDGRTAEDSKSLKEQNPIIDIDKDFVFQWGDKERRFFAPPDRPNDRSVLIPVNPKWLNK